MGRAIVHLQLVAEITYCQRAVKARVNVHSVSQSKCAQCVSMWTQKMCIGSSPEG